MLFDFQTKTPALNILYACLSSNSMIWVENPEESLKTFFIRQLLQIGCGILQSCRLRYCAFKPFFLLFELLFTAKVLLNCEAVAQSFFVVFQSESIKNISHD